MAVQTWAALGAASDIYVNPELSRKSRFISAHQVRCHEVVDPATEFNLGKKSGDTVGFRLVGRLTDLADSALGELTPIPLGDPPIYSGTGVVYRRGYGINWTGTRADLDRLDVEDMNIRALREHAARTMNKVIYDALAAARSFCYVPLTASTQNFTTTGSPSGTAAYAMTGYHWRKLCENLEANNVPYFDGESYAAVVSTKLKYDLLGDSGFIDVKKYSTGGAEGILNNEFGSAYGFRFILDNDRVANAIGSGSAFGSGIACGYEAMKEIMVYPTHFRSNLNYGGDFGNQAAIAWQNMQGYKAPWNFTTHGDGRIAHITTA